MMTPSDVIRVLLWGWLLETLDDEDEIALWERTG